MSSCRRTNIKIEERGVHVTKIEFITNLIQKLDINDTLDSQNYNHKKEQLCDIYKLIDEYLDDFTIVEGSILK